jgi:hypothetical protein
LGISQLTFSAKRAPATIFPLGLRPYGIYAAGAILPFQLFFKQNLFPSNRNIPEENHAIGNGFVGVFLHSPFLGDRGKLFHDAGLHVIPPALLNSPFLIRLWRFSRKR